jgi:phage terminase large subunit-like protein
MPSACAGARSLVATTVGDDPSSFAKAEHDECVKIAEDPDRAPHRFVYLRNLPEDADPWDEANWYHSNPALGDFLSLAALREEALEARNDLAKENAFRQYRLNQWVSQTTRWMPTHLYLACTGAPVDNPARLRERLAHRPAWGGLDLASKLDLTAWCLIVSDGSDGHVSALWRFWLPEAGLVFLDERPNHRVSRWAEQGWLTISEGEVIDYEVIENDITTDTGLLRVADISYDEWSGEPVRQRLERRTGVPMYPVPQTYKGMSHGMTELMTLTRSRDWSHHGNPVAEFASTQSRFAVRWVNRTSFALVSPNVGKRARGLMRYRPLLWPCQGGACVAKRRKNLLAWLLCSGVVSLRHGGWGQ